LKILKHGHRNIVTCSQCESVLQYDKSDTIVKMGGVQWDPYDEYWIQCPVCKKELKVVVV
jgi:uncharacterized protein YbaR (Trm112 family)